MRCDHGCSYDVRPPPVYGGAAGPGPLLIRERRNISRRPPITPGGCGGANREATGPAAPADGSMGDHDALFKRAFAVPKHAAAELRCVLPEAACERLELGALEMLPASFVDEEMAHRHADLLFRAPIRGDASERAYVYVLLEHQSEPDRLMAWRVLTYMQRIWSAIVREQPAKTSLPPIIPVVVHHGTGGWRAPRRFHELISGLEALPELLPLVPDFELLVDDLGAISHEALRTRPMPPFAKLALWLLRDGRQLEVLLSHLAVWADELAELARRDPSHQDRAVLARYILRVAGEMPSEQLRERIAKDAPELEETMATIEEQLIQKGVRQGVEQGLRQGVEQGVRQGRAEALRETLERQLRARFGPVEQAISQRIAAASAVDLDRWLERVITAERPADVFDR